MEFVDVLGTAVDLERFLHLGVEILEFLELWVSKKASSISVDFKQVVSKIEVRSPCEVLVVFSPEKLFAQQWEKQHLHHIVQAIGLEAYCIGNLVLW